MVVQHTPQKTPDESGTNLVPWKFTIGGQEEVIYVNEDQNKYLTLDTTTPEQQKEFLQRIFEDQQRRQVAAATAAATTKSEDLNPSRNSPTPTDQILEDIRERTNIIEESLPKNTEVKKLYDDGHDGDENGHDGAACRDRHHEFEQRTKTHLAAPAKKFIKACNSLMVQLDRHKYADEVSKQYGDELLNDVQDLYLKLEEAREYCLEPLNDDERLQYEEYLQIKFELKCTCERVHRQYFEQVEQNKKLRNQQQMMTQPQQPQVQVQPPNDILAHLEDPYNAPHGTTYGNFGPQPPIGPAILPTIITTTAANNMPGMMSSTPFHPHPIPQPGANFAPIYGHPQGQHYGQAPNPPPGFNVYDSQESRIPTPTPPSVINAHHHTRFKLNEELSLVQPWNGSQPREYMAFRAQWTNFVEKMKQADRSNLDLYYALLKVLDGAAKKLVETKYPNDQSYNQSMKKLDNLFFNPANLVRDMVHNLLKGVKMVDTYDSLLSGITKLMDAWNDLDQADLSKNQLKGLLFIAATEKNLSEESWKEWLSIQNDPKYRQNPMMAFEISTYMGAINTAMLNAQKRKNAIGPSPETSPKTGKPKRQSTLYGSYSNAIGNQDATRRHDDMKSNYHQSNNVQQQARGPNNMCITCGQNPHKYQLNCPKLREMTPNQIYKIMTNSGIECQMCLGLNHRTRECPATQEGFLKKCSVREDNVECGRYHCRYLHKKRANDESNQPKSSQ